MVGRVIATPPVTRAEALQLARRRANLTQSELGASLGVMADRVRQWEKGTRTHDCPAVPAIELRPFEWCWLMRERAGVTLHQLSAQINLAVRWIHRAERGELQTEQIGVLIDWWSETRCIHE